MLQTDSTTIEMARHLRQIKLLHTLIWAVMAGAILLLPIAGWLRRNRLAFALSLLVLAEGLVLAFNRGRCPLTDIATRYTTDRPDNFDIYLPVWLARYNKLIFGSLFVIGESIWWWQLRRSRT